MDMVGEEVGCPTLTDAQRCKIKKDKIRVRRRNVQQKRLHVLNNSSKLAVHIRTLYNSAQKCIKSCTGVQSGIEKKGGLA